MAAKRIDAHRPLFDQQFACLVQHQRRLLLRALDRNEAHSRARHRFAAGIGVDRVVLANAANAIAAAMEKPDKGRETWTFMTMLLVNFPLGVPGSSRLGLRPN
jgi:hypothetical protein